ncbi:excisionase family DNA-binding protein [Bacillus alkalicellulosilyticus]|uniref:excisionase family DNA-binding protein n=1 Tax=Alkalihalobacterium alkalicellulosilyticum TaxID=1912214 RepID=UPI00099639BF|nr:excisionase family DNA-binding protein [Bacillus alkalicellulosilyticus]
MYITVDELAEFLNVTPEYLQEQIRVGNLTAVHDGKEYLVNKEQFRWHKEQIEKRIIEFRLAENEEIPEDVDVKDED